MSVTKLSPAITVSEHISIGETIQTLIENKVGSVLVTSYSAPHKLVGIFTERDLLKWVFDFKDHNLWNTAIGTIMTKKVICLSILNLDQANEVMLKNNIRHLPVMYQDEKGEEHLAGIISMRDAFRTAVHENSALLKRLGQSTSRREIRVLAKSLVDQQLQKKILSRHTHLEIIPGDFNQILQPQTFLPEVLKADVFIFDLDGFSIQFWPILLKMILDEPKHPDLFVIYHPALHEKKNIEALKTISSGNVVHAFSKPVNLLQYLSQIEASMTN